MCAGLAVLVDFDSYCNFDYFGSPADYVGLDNSLVGLDYCPDDFLLHTCDRFDDLDGLDLDFGGNSGCNCFDVDILGCCTAGRIVARIVAHIVGRTAGRIAGCIAENSSGLYTFVDTGKLTEENVESTNIEIQARCDWYSHMWVGSSGSA